MTEYKLINPHIEGKFKSLCQGKSPIDAASEIWNNLSKNITNNVPEFAFTIQRVKDNNMFHFKINETIENDEVNFTISQLDTNLTAAKKKKFLKKLDDFKNRSQDGGHRKKKRHNKDDDDDDDDTSTDSEYYKDILKQYAKKQQVSYYWYYPGLYPFDYDYVFLPTWYNIYPQTTISWF